ncbi:hypothetical protein ACFL0L_01250 [Patescibacteria group bacterium]
MATPMYRPKMKVGTVKDLAQRLASTKAGKKVNTDAFKKFLKQDKDLRRTALRSPTTHLKKAEAAKFLGTVAKKIHESDKMKLSMFARKKMQIHKGLESSGQVSKLSVKRLYQTGAKEEFEAEKPQGPSKAEIEKTERRDRARQILRTRERADEIRQEYKTSFNKNTDNKNISTNQQKGSYRPPQLTHGSAASQASRQPSQGNILSTPKQLSDDSSPHSAQAIRNANTVILPFYNKSRMQELTLLGEKLEETLRRALAGVSILQVLSRVETTRAIRKLGWAEGRVITSEFAKKVGNRLDISYLLFGTLAHEVSQAHMELFLLLFNENSLLKIADIREDFHQTFEIEKKLIWQVQEFFEEKEDDDSGDKGPPVPSASDAVDLPI